MTNNRQLVLSLSLLAGAIGVGYALSSTADPVPVAPIQSEVRSEVLTDARLGGKTDARPAGQPGAGTLEIATADTPLPTATVAAIESVPFHLDPLDVHPRTSLTVVEQLRTSHYLPKGLNDDASSATFDKYLESLDGGRSYLLASDVTEFEEHRYKLDDALKRGQLKPAFAMFNRYQNRVVNRLEYVLADLEDGIDDLQFTANERLQIDRENAAWPANEVELDDLWRRRLKANILSMKLNGKELDEIRTVLTKRYKNRLKQTRLIRSEDAFQIYMNAFASTYDPHTSYLSPRTSETFNINMSLSLEGIGAVLRTEDDYTEVVSLVTAGPAEKSGQIKPADRIVSVGQGERGELIDVVGWRLDDVVELVRGPKGSIVRLEVQLSEGDYTVLKEIRMVREAVELEEQSAQKRVLTITDAGRERKIGVIDVPTFYVDMRAQQNRDPNYRSTTRDVRRLIEELRAEGIEGLVIDLRNNGGGSLQEADMLTGLFIKSGPTVQVKSARRRANVYADRDDSIAWDGPMAVLVNRLSASASEIFAGAIQDYDRGLVLGSQTFGKGTVQTLIPLNRGQLKITQAKFYRISGQSTQHQGVIPDIEFPELYDVERIGESSLDDALPWDVIPAAIFEPYDSALDPMIANLQERHDQRTATDPDFDYLRSLSAKSEENRQRTHISLSEPMRLDEKAADDAWRLNLENTLRSAKGEPVLKTLEELEKDEEDAENKEEDEPAEKDAMLRESGHILIDLISARRQLAAVELRDGQEG